MISHQPRRKSKRSFWLPTLLLALALSIGACGGLLTNPSSVPTGVSEPIRFVIKGAVGDLRCTGSVERELVNSAANGNQVEVTLSGDGRDSEKFSVRFTWLARSQEFARLGWQSAVADANGLRKINLAIGGGRTDRVLVCTSGSNYVFSPTPAPSSAPANSNTVVCATVRKTVSSELSDAVSLYSSNVISLDDLGRIYLAWAEGARGINRSATGQVKELVSRLISLAEQTGTAARAGSDSGAIDGIVAFADALTPLDAACP